MGDSRVEQAKVSVRGSRMGSGRVGAGRGSSRGASGADAVRGGAESVAMSTRAGKCAGTCVRRQSVEEAADGPQTDNGARRKATAGDGSAQRVTQAVGIRMQTATRSNGNGNESKKYESGDASAIERPEPRRRSSPVKKKNPYRAIDVKSVDVTKLDLEGQERIAVGVDIAKVAMKAAVVDSLGRLVVTVKWKHPRETAEFVGFLKDLGPGVEVAAESTGSYGTALVSNLRARGFRVFAVSTKRSHDAAEVFDGVPSQHDAKDAYVLARLHLYNCSNPWRERSAEQRDLQAQLRQLDRAQQCYQQNLNRLEGLVAAYWPGVTAELDLDRVTLWALLEKFEWSGAVAARPDIARRLMRVTGRRWLTDEKIDSVLRSAANASGLQPTGGEAEELRDLLRSLRETSKAVDEQRRRLEQRGEKYETVRMMAPTLGLATATILFAEVGDPSNYGSASAYLKAMGLNLRERSSGQYQGRVSLTKRGPSRVRKYAYLATLRLLHKDEVVAAWYDGKVKRDGGKHKRKAVVAVMRKLVRAMFHVGQGSPFDARKLFDTRKLGLVEQAA